MTSESKTTVHHINTVNIQARDYRLRTAALKVGFFIWHYFEMMLAMGIGGFLFSLLLHQIPESSSYASVFARGTYLRAIVSSLFMTVPMVAWMIIRGHGWRHSWEMTGAMLAPRRARSGRAPTRALRRWMCSKSGL